MIQKWQDSQLYFATVTEPFARFTSSTNIPVYFPFEIANATDITFDATTLLGGKQHLFCEKQKHI